MKKTLIEAPLGYWEEKSYMMAIPKDDSKNLLSDVIERIATIPKVKIVDTDYDIEGHIYVTLSYEKEQYEVGVYLGPVNVPEYYLNHNFLFTKEEAQGLLNARLALTIYMEFKKNAKKSYHLQLKIANAIVPELLGVLDESAERMLPARWVSLAANSKVLPSSKDLFSVQAVSGKNSKVWMHTHGMTRCHMIELEILESDQANYNNHFNLLSIYAMYCLDKGEAFDPRIESAYIGQLINGYPVVVTCRSWTEAIFEYKKLQLGGEKDRQQGHNTMTSPMFLFKSQQDEQNGTLSKINEYDSLWGDNPLYFFSDEETQRMKDLAMERFEFVKRSFDEKSYDCLLKIGLPLKQKGKFEHIWFELLEIDGDKFKAKLTQEPYDIPDIHTGYTNWFTVENITDWLIYTPEFAVNPSNVYLLEEI